jgi:hypothetical protein
MPIDRLLNSVLLTAMVLAGAWMFFACGSSPSAEKPSEEESGSTATLDKKPPSDTATTKPLSGDSAELADLGEVNLFAPLYTPTPTPPPPTPQPTPGPNLSKAVQTWQLEYPMQQGSKWVFSDRKDPDMSFTIEIGTSFTVSDGHNTFKVVAEKDGKWGIILKYEEQTKKFSMIE